MLRLILIVAFAATAAGCNKSPAAPTPRSVNSLLPPASPRATASSIVPDYSGGWIGDMRMSACDSTSFGVCGRMSSLGAGQIALTLVQAGVSMSFVYGGRAFNGYITDSHGIYAERGSSEERSVVLLRRAGDGFEGILAVDSLVQGVVVTSSARQITNLRRAP